MVRTTFRGSLVIVLTSLWAVSDPVDADEMFLGGTGLGVRQPFGMVVVTPCMANIPRGGGLFLQSLEFTADYGQAYGITWDRLRVLDVSSGAAEDLGRFEYGKGYQWTFSLDEDESWEPFASPDLDGVNTYSYHVNGVLTFSDSSFEVVQEEDVILIGSMPIPFVETVIHDQILTYPPEGPAELTVRLLITLMEDGAIILELTDFEGDGHADYSGQIVVGTPGSATASLLVHPIRGLSLSPTGVIHALGAATSEPAGAPTLYTVEPDTDETGQPILVLTPLASLDTREIWAIEFADDGTLYGAGESLHTIDVETGTTTLLGPTGAGVIVDLDSAVDGTLFGIGRTDDGQSDLYELDLQTGQAYLITPMDGESVWGLGVLPFNLRDLNRDGLVDDQDLAFYDAEFTGSLTQPVIPPGNGTPSVPDVLTVPLVGSLDFAMLDDSDASRYDMDALDAEFPGIVVTGPQLDPADSCAQLYLAHTEDQLYVRIEVLDDHVGVSDWMEMYLNSNNSDLPITEGDPFGFQAISDGTGQATSVWDIGGLPTLRGKGIAFLVEKEPTQMVTGGTYGFDIAVNEVDDDDDGQGETTRYFLFSEDDSGTQNEQLWGDIFLSPGGPGGRAFAPSPAHQATGVDADPILSWTGGSDAITHNVYLGSDPAHLVFQGNQTETTFDPGTLSQGWTYTWRIDEVNDNGIRTGALWLFTTLPSPADLDRDGDVDIHDFRILVQDPLGDIDGNSVIDHADFLVLYEAMGSMIGEPGYSALVDFDSDGEITEADYLTWYCLYQTDQQVFLDAGDPDGDGDVDLHDYSAWLDCVSGPGTPVSDTCFLADLDADGDADADLIDFGLLTIVFRD